MPKEPTKQLGSSKTSCKDAVMFSRALGFLEIEKWAKDQEIAGSTPVWSPRKYKVYEA
jgi:hypothetical protein